MEIAQIKPMVEKLPKFKNLFKEILNGQVPVIGEESLKGILERVHSDFCNLFKKDPWVYEILKERTYFAGGCIRDLVVGKPPKDWDLFFCDKIESIELLGYFEKLEKDRLKKDPFDAFAAQGINFYFSKNKNVNLSITDDGYGYIAIQLITVQSGTPEQIINRFDFKHNTGYYWPSQNKLNIPEEIRTKELKIMPDTLFPVNAFIRLARFISEGYTITPEEIVKLAILVQARPSLLDKENLTKETFGLSFHFGE